MSEPEKRTAGNQRGRPFSRGRSGNPGGRPKGVPNKATREVREIARAIIDDPEYRRRLVKRVQDGKVAPAVEALLWHYAYGKPKDTVEVSGSGGGPVTFSWLPAPDSPASPEG